MQPTELVCRKHIIYYVIAPNLSVFHVLYNEAALAAAPPQNQKMFKIGAVYVVRSLHTHFEPNQTILAMFCTQPAKSPHLSTPPYILLSGQISFIFHRYPFQ